MTMPRDYARCMGSEPHLQTLCVGCARYYKNNDDPEGERVVYSDFKPIPENKLSGVKWICTARHPVRHPEDKWWDPKSNG